MGGGEPWKGLSAEQSPCHLAWSTPADPVSALVPAGVGLLPDLFSFSIPFIAQTTSGPQKNKPLSSADLRFLASIVCHLLILASDHFHPYPPPKGRHRPRIAARKGGCGVCGQSSHSDLAGGASSSSPAPPQVGDLGGALGQQQTPFPPPLSCQGPSTHRVLTCSREEGLFSEALSPFKQKPGCFLEETP